MPHSPILLATALAQLAALQASSSMKATAHTQQALPRHCDSQFK
jgi:hypothetical protein